MALTLTDCAWPLCEDPGLLGCDAVSLALGVPDVSKGYAFISREDVLDCLTLDASHAARCI